MTNGSTPPDMNAIIRAQARRTTSGAGLFGTTEPEPEPETDDDGAGTGDDAA